MRNIKLIILKTDLAIATRDICQNLYQEKGSSAVYDYANKIKLRYSPCVQCNAETPVIECLEWRQCAICGSSNDFVHPELTIESVVDLIRGINDQGHTVPLSVRYEKDFEEDGNPWELEIEDQSYFYERGGDRDKDYFQLQQMLPLVEGLKYEFY